ncbi:hypothetical protein FVE85_8550 [Porphyridium purpureum]|uniref:Integrase catalytic domain-containing protein n=1 Tax=Porphyridium purpureum TaxID=35688 RepID=A0A5J4YPH2_PORPP|nr:hypothetical protein FVE85_8550 [Porphyridium purpureum]|eukprot:POR7513..scf296_7
MFSGGMLRASLYKSADDPKADHVMISLESAFAFLDARVFSGVYHKRMVRTFERITFAKMEARMRNSTRHGILYVLYFEKLKMAQGCLPIKFQDNKSLLLQLKHAVEDENFAGNALLQAWASDDDLYSQLLENLDRAARNRSNAQLRFPGKSAPPENDARASKALFSRPVRKLTEDSSKPAHGQTSARSNGNRDIASQRACYNWKRDWVSQHLVPQSGQTRNPLWAQLWECALLARCGQKLNSAHKTGDIVGSLTHTEIWGFWVDTGATNSFVSLPQGHAYCVQANQSSQPLQTKAKECSFDVGTYKVLGQGQARLPVSDEFYFIFLLDVLGTADANDPSWPPAVHGLKDMDGLKCYFNNFQDLVFPKLGLSCRLQRKFGKLFLIASLPFDRALLTHQELQKIHRKFAHASAAKLEHIFDLAGTPLAENDTSTLRALIKNCHICQRFAKKPRSPELSASIDVSFNHTVQLDHFYLHQSAVNRTMPVMHVICAGTRFQTGQWLPDGCSAQALWDIFNLIWVTAYSGAPHIVKVDPGSAYDCADFKSLANASGIYVSVQPIEAHESIGKIERAHAIIRTMYDKYTEEDPNADNDEALAHCFLVANCTPSHSVAPPALMVFGPMPRLVIGAVADIPSQTDRIKAMLIARLYVLLIKPLYGLTESAMYWWFSLQEVLSSLSLRPSFLDPCLFSSQAGVVGVLSDNILYCGTEQILQDVHTQLSKFTMSAIQSIPMQFNGAVLEDAPLRMHHKPYIDALLSDAAMPDTAARARGKVRWLASLTRPDLLWFQFTDASALLEREWSILKRYLRDTRDWTLIFRPSKPPLSIHSYSDAAFADDHSLKSRLGFVIFLCDSAGQAQVLHARLYLSPRVVRSVSAAEIYAASNCLDFTLALQAVLHELYNTIIPVTFFTDSQSIFDTAQKVHVITEKRLMIDVQQIRDALANGQIENVSRTPRQTLRTA